MTRTESDVVRSRPRLVSRTIVSAGRAERCATSLDLIHAPLATANVVASSAAPAARGENPYRGILLPVEVKLDGETGGPVRTGRRARSGPPSKHRTDHTARADATAGSCYWPCPGCLGSSE